MKETYRIRLSEDRKEIFRKMCDLDSFICSKEFDELDNTHKVLLYEQRHLMYKYIDALDKVLGG